jgi:outer membrane immunogenic protein
MRKLNAVAVFAAPIVVATLTAMGIAAAADLPPAPPPAPAYIPPPAPPPAYNWSGFYGGLNGGYGWASSNSTAVFSGGLLSGATASGSGQASGGVFGGQLGFNYQINALVLGIEGDIDWSGQSSSQSVGCGFGCTLSQTAKIAWLGTIRGRVGLALDRVLLYATGGGAFSNLSNTITATGFGTIYNASATDTGWVLGGGVELALAQNWTTRLEYLYVQTNASLTGGLALIGGSVTQTGTVKDSIVRVGVNFKYP